MAQLTREARLVARDWTAAVDPDALAAAAGAAIGHRVTLIDHRGVVVGDSEFRGEARAAPRESQRPPRGDGSAARRCRKCGSHEPVRGRSRALRRGAIRARRHARFDLDREPRWRSWRAGSAMCCSPGSSRSWPRCCSLPRSRARSRGQSSSCATSRGRSPRAISRAAPRSPHPARWAISRRRCIEWRSSSRAASRRWSDDDMLMNAVIESLQEGVIAVDARRQVVRVNESGRRMLRLPDAVPFPADRLPRDHTLREALAAGLAGESTGADRDHRRRPEHDAHRATRWATAAWCSRCSISPRRGAWRRCVEISSPTSRTSSRRRSR